MRLLIIIIQFIGSILFLIGAILYICDSTIAGLYVYLTCAIFYTTGSVLEIIVYVQKKETIS